MKTTIESYQNQTQKQNQFKNKIIVVTPNGTLIVKDND